MSNAAVDQDEAEDRYYTQVDAGDVRLFTLDQLDAAFNAGLIHENTYVCLEGSSEWLTLAEVAGLGEEEPVSAPQPVAQPVPQYAAYAAPQVTSAPYSVAPIVAPSIRPVTSDLSFDDDFEMMAMRPKRRIGKVLAGVAVLGLAGLGFAVVQSGGLKLPKLDLGASNGQAAAASLTLSSLKDSTQAAPQPVIAPTPTPAPEAAKPEPPKAEEAKPVEAAAASDKSADKADDAKKADDRFSEEMKAALLAKDKKQAVTTKTKKAARAAIATKRSKGKGSGGGFKAGGSAYDPLNGKL
ncbi:MAG TPA: DUF4339 domain-containing protein [Polyangiaceae bacterium]|nr:DUF4339 domain-containing protein [Polyangiaceae bacterium]